MSDVIEIDHDLAAANIEAFAREGRLVQGEWHRGGGGDGGDAGREFACLLGSIHPSINSTDKCPAELMPRWMANLTVRLFDGVPFDRIQEFGLAYAQRLHRWKVIDADGWERVRRAFIRQVLTGAMSGWEAKLGANPPELWAPIKALHERLLSMLLGGTATWKDYSALRDEAYELRSKAWTAWNAAAARRRRAAVAAVAAEAAEAAAAVAVVAVAAVAVAVAVAVARRQSYAKSFEILLGCIDTEIDAR